MQSPAMLRFLLVCFHVLLFLASVQAAESKKLLLIGQGPDGHPPGTHEFVAGIKVIDALLKPYATHIRTTITKPGQPARVAPEAI